MRRDIGQARRCRLSAQADQPSDTEVHRLGPTVVGMSGEVPPPAPDRIGHNEHGADNGGF